MAKQESETITELVGKHVLLDTNFIVRTYENAESSHFDELFSLLKQHDCIPVITQLIRYEFLQGAKQPKYADAKSRYLRELTGTELPLTTEVIEDTTLISQLMNNKGKQLSLVDASITACLKKYYGNLVVVTTNYRDFPQELHDRFFVQAIDLGSSIETLAFVKFNSTKFKKVHEDFKKSIEKTAKYK